MLLDDDCLVERRWEDVPAFFKPQDGPVTMGKLEISAWLCQGESATIQVPFWARKDALPHFFQFLWFSWPGCPYSVPSFSSLSLGDEVWPPASTASDGSI